MPPPRPLRPLRPCYFPRSSHQVRWASDSPRDKLRARHGELPQTTGSEQGRQDSLEQAREDVISSRESDLSSSELPQPLPPACNGLWGSLIGRASTLLSKKQPPTSQESSRQLPSVASESNPPPSEPADSLHRSVGQSGHAKANNVRDDTQKQGVLRVGEEGKKGHRDEGTIITHVCATCNEEFRSSTRLTQHMLLSERCYIDRPSLYIQYSCRSCKVNFRSIAAARRHVERSPECYDNIQFRNLRVAAEDRFRKSTGTLIVAARMLNGMSSPVINPIATRAQEHLRLIWEDVPPAKDKQWLETLKDVGFPESSQPAPEIRLASEKSGYQLVRRLNQEVKFIERQAQNILYTSSVKKHSRGTRKTKKLNQSSKSITSAATQTHAASHASANAQYSKVALESDRPRKPERADDATSQPQSVLQRLSGEQQPDSRSKKYLALKGSHLKEEPGIVADIRRKLSKLNDVERSNKAPPEISATSRTTPHNRDPKLPPQNSPHPFQGSIAIAPNLDPSADLRLQLQELKEQVRLLQEKLTLAVPELGLELRGRSSVTTPPSETTINTTRQLNSRSVPLTQPELDPSPAKEPAWTRSLEDGSPAIPDRHSQKKTKGALTDMPLVYETQPESRNDSQRLTRQIHTHARLMRSSDHSDIPAAHLEGGNLENKKTTQQSPETSSMPDAPSTNEASEQSLLEELFPEASSYIQPHYSGRHSYPKLDLPSSVPIVRRLPTDVPKSERDKVIESFQNRSEQITALQLLHCSTELTEADFRRLVPKGKHIDSWTRDGEFYKVIPGRDPLNLERLPFYYLLFKSPESAIAYQKNVARLHKLSQLHQSSNILSAIPPPKGFLEDGEDINLATTSYLLKPTGLQLNLNMVMQPYNPALRALIDQGGYKPIVPSASLAGKPIWKVLMHIEGYEPSPLDLYQLLRQDGHARGIQWPFHNEQSAILRLRDIINLKARLLPVSSSNPRASNNPHPEQKQLHQHMFEDPHLSFLTQDPEKEKDNALQVNQMLMNRLYNRWIVEFEEEDAARRFARLWNRRVLPVSKSAKHVTWRDIEEARLCNTEFLW